MKTLERILLEVNKTEINGTFCKKNIIKKLGIRRSEATYAFKRMIDRGEITFYKSHGNNPTYEKLKEINIEINIEKSKMSNSILPKKIIHDVVYKFIFAGDVRRMQEGIQ